MIRFILRHKFTLMFMLIVIGQYIPGPFHDWMMTRNMPNSMFVYWAFLVVITGIDFVHTSKHLKFLHRATDGYIFTIYQLLKDEEFYRAQKKRYESEKEKVDKIMEELRKTF